MRAAAAIAANMMSQAAFGEAKRAADIAAARVRPAVAHIGVRHGHAAIAARPRELQAKRARHRGFGPAGIGRAVAARVADDGTHRAGRGRLRACAQAARSAVAHKESGSANSAAVRREAGRFTRSSSRAAAQPKAS